MTRLVIDLTREDGADVGVVDLRRVMWQVSLHLYGEPAGDRPFGYEVGGGVVVAYRARWWLEESGP